MIPVGSVTLVVVIDAANPFSPRESEPGPAAERPADEMVLLDGLEQDLAAVETAIATIDRIATEGTGGEQSAAEIGAAVSPERFGLGDAEAPSTPDGADRPALGADGSAPGADDSAPAQQES
jgi:hypothetical protein